VRHRVPYLVLALAVILLIAGLSMGEFRAVLANALTVCLSCIGIG
jgi:hypothetical protein